MAAAMGWADRDSMAPTSLSNSVSVIEPKTWISVTSGRPMVSVPVLSKAMAFSRLTVSI